MWKNTQFSINQETACQGLSTKAAKIKKTVLALSKSAHYSYNYISHCLRSQTSLLCFCFKHTHKFLKLISPI